MSLRTWLVKLLSLSRKQRLDGELAGEIEAHLEQAEQDYRKVGMTALEARRAARRSFGGIEQLKEQHRDQRGFPRVEALWWDVRYSARGLLKSPGFSAVAVCSLALGIGANTAIFTLVDQVLIRALPVEQPDELVLFESPGPNPGMVRRTGSLSFSHPLYRDFDQQLDSFSGILAQFPLRLSLRDGGVVEEVEGVLVSGNYFEVLGLRPALGRLLTPDDDRQPDSHPVAVLSYDFWRRRFGADPNIVGLAITLHGRAMTVVGVSPAGFRGLEIGSAADVMIPLMMMEPMTPRWEGLQSRRVSWLNIYGRLKPWVTPADAEVRANVLFGRILAREESEMQRVSEGVRERFLARRLRLLPGGQGLPSFRTYFSSPLLVLAAGVGIVLLIACANLAALLTVRAAKRQREIAVRRAIGAGRARIVRQALVESLILSNVGASLGLVLAYWANQAILGVWPLEGIDRAISAGPDLRVLAFSVALSLVTALLFGLGPAVQATRAAVAPGLRAEGGGTSRREAARFRSAMVGSQVALAVVLLSAAGAFVLSLHKLESLDLGFQPKGLVSFELDPAALGYTRSQGRSLISRLDRRFRNLPGLDAVSFVISGPLNKSNTTSVRVGGPEAEEVSVTTDWAGPDYFSTIGLPVLAGREFTAADLADSPRVAVINRAMAKRYFNNENPLGQNLFFAYDRRQRPIEIVGIVGNSKLREIAEDGEPCLYLAYMQNSYSAVNFIVRSGLPPATLSKMLRELFAKTLSSSPIVEVKPLGARVEDVLFIERTLATASSTFGLLAVFLAGIGLYGVVSYAVVQRTKELGIRIAIGATPGRLIGTALKDVGRTTVVGAAIGIGGALLLGRLIESQLYGVTATQPLLIATAAVVVLLAASAASALPAIRAARIDPIRALRCD